MPRNEIHKTQPNAFTEADGVTDQLPRVRKNRYAEEAKDPIPFEFLRLALTALSHPAIDRGLNCRFLACSMP